MKWEWEEEKFGGREINLKISKDSDISQIGETGGRWIEENKWWSHDDPMMTTRWSYDDKDWLLTYQGQL